MSYLDKNVKYYFKNNGLVFNEFKNDWSAY